MPPDSLGSLIPPSVAVPRTKKIDEKRTKRPRVEVQASTDDTPSSEWGSLLGDLARPSRLPSDVEVEWRVHDKTHLEFAIDYPFAAEPASYTWEAFFFVPESFRLDANTYDKKEMYEDLLSYVRLAVPEVTFDDLARITDPEPPPNASPHELTARFGATMVDRLERRILATEGPGGEGAVREATRIARVFACVARASGVNAQREMLAALATETDREQRIRLVQSFVASARRVTGAYREMLARVARKDVPEEIRVALRWVDEDLSLLVESTAASASIHLHEQAADDGTHEELAARLASEAVTEARYREQKEYPSVTSRDATPREMEHLEFRRHMLKRFTSSVLWLTHEVREGAAFVLQLLYAVAAAVAMAFAVWATLHATQMQEYFTLSAIILVASYAIKDRMKAFLQTYFSRWVERRFPDRLWTIRDHERKLTIGSVRERAGFRLAQTLPRGVMQVRRLTREHALEEFARPEKILWHEKSVTVSPRPESMLPSPMLTEIFRLNIGQWLEHTDDPNRVVPFADPSTATVCSASARRVYNINVIYRLRRADGEHDGREPAYKRIRVVVSRKGIERIDPIV